MLKKTRDLEERNPWENQLTKEQLLRAASELFVKTLRSENRTLHFNQVNEMGYMVSSKHCISVFASFSSNISNSRSSHQRCSVKKVFSCEFCEISKNTFSYRTPPVVASQTVASWSSRWELFWKKVSLKYRQFLEKYLWRICFSTLEARSLQL